MRVVVDLARCQGYGQCVFLAPDVFSMAGEEALLYDLEPDERERAKVLRAAAACPVQALQVEPVGFADPEPEAAPEPTTATDGDFMHAGRVVIVGASLAGLRAAEKLREEGFAGSLTLVGEESAEPYDRPPMSKQVLEGRIPAHHTALPRLRRDRRRLAARGRRDRAGHGGQARPARRRQEIGFDRLLIATGVRARPWPNAVEAALDGVIVAAHAGRRRQAARARRCGSAARAGHRRRFRRLARSRRCAGRWACR